MTEFIRVLRHGSWLEKRKVLKYAGLGSYSKYGLLEIPKKGSKIIKKNQIIVNEYEVVGKFWFIEIRYRLVYLINPCFCYKLIYTKKGRLLFMSGAGI